MVVVVGVSALIGCGDAPSTVGPVGAAPGVEDAGSTTELPEADIPPPPLDADLPNDEGPLPLDVVEWADDVAPLDTGPASEDVPSAADAPGELGPDIPDVLTPDSGPEAEDATAATDPGTPPDTAEDAVEVQVLPPGECCKANEGPGCTTAACESAVCALDDYCCADVWDSLCVTCAQGGTTATAGDCSGVVGACGCEPPPPTHFELAEKWAPVWHHDSDDTDAVADYITAFDFDGDNISNNNWENLHAPEADLRAMIYWSVVETETHWFILYTDFHARDWTEDCDPFLPFKEPCHENDMEGAMVVVRKGTDPFGKFEVLYTEAHNTLHVFTNNPAIQPASTPNLETEGVSFEDGTHVELYVESKGHGVCALYYDGEGHCQHPTDGAPPPFPGGDGIVFRYNGGLAEVPESGNDPDVGYALLPFEDTVWAHREDVCDDGCMFDGQMTYDGVQLPKAFDGDTWGKDKANPPWAWDDPDDGPVFRGDFFFRPAKAMVTHLDVPGPVSQKYVVNPYLFGL